MEREDQVRAAKLSAACGRPSRRLYKAAPPASFDVQAIKRRGSERLAAAKRMVRFSLCSNPKTARCRAGTGGKLWFYVAVDNVAAADALLDELDNSWHLGRRPKMGALVRSWQANCEVPVRRS